MKEENDVPLTADEFASLELEGPARSRHSFWRRLWPAKGDPERTHVFGVPARWLVAVGLFTAAVTIVLCAIGTSFPRTSIVRAETGTYAQDAPFVEVLSSNFPDPALFRVNRTWHVYGTNNAAGIIDSKIHGNVKDFGLANVQLATSQNLLDWTFTEDPKGPLPELGAWVTPEKMRAQADPSVEVGRANVWAPEILQRPDGKFVLYYSATAVNESANGVHCVGAAISNQPEGPFKPEENPIVCPVGEGGAIDPAGIIDTDGSIYVAYKVDGNLRGFGGECRNTVRPQKATPIFLQKMEQDGITSTGAPVQILDRNPEDGPLVEAPALFRSDEGVYFLFFSSGCTFSSSYNIKYATSRNILGPYTRAKEPLLQTGSYGLLSPGSPAVWNDDRNWYLAFHARLYTDLGGIRGLYLTSLSLNGTVATLESLAAPA